jgi:hypothetical protein
MTMFKFTRILTVATMIAAMAATCFGASDEWKGSGAVDEFWSNTANWTLDGVGPLPTIKTVIGEQDFGVVGANDVTLDIVTVGLPVFEMFGKGVLNIVAGGVLNVVNAGDAEFKIYTGNNGTGDEGSRINLLGGSIVIEDGVTVQLGDTGVTTIGLFGGNGSNVEGVGWEKVSAGGFTTYTGLGNDTSVPGTVLIVK